MIAFPIGTWELPSGNRVAVSIRQVVNGGPVQVIRCAWDSFPPSKKDRRYYRDTLVDAINSRIAEYKEVRLREMLVVQIEG